MKNILKLLCLMILGAQSCSREYDCNNPDTVNYYFNVADSEKVKIPYLGNEELVFVSNKGDTAKLKGQEKKTYYEKKTIYTGSPECQTEENYHYENLKFIFTGDTIIKDLYINIYKPNSTTGTSNPIFTLVGIKINDNEEVYSSSNYFDYKTTLSADDSVLINNVYLKGYYFANEIGKRHLYNFKQGILKLEYPQNLFWTKIK